MNTDSANVFQYTEFFSKNEEWGNPREMNGLLILLLDTIRRVLDVPITINAGYAISGHARRSQHYFGNAADFVVHGLDFATAAIRIDKLLDELQVADVVGFGIYPEWHTPGFHLDVRGTHARWARVGGRYVAYEPVMRSIKDSQQ